MSLDNSDIKPVKTVYSILWALCVTHFFNDTFQAVIPSVFPLLKDELTLSLFTVGLISTVFQLSSSIFQPLIGWYCDKHPQPYILPLGLTSTCFGLVMLSQAWNFPLVLFSVVFIGIGSAVVHPEATRLAYLASGGRLGFAQSVFQVGGNAGQAFAPLLVFLLVYQFGGGKQGSIIWFSFIAFFSICWVVPLSKWYAKRLQSGKEELAKAPVKKTPAAGNAQPQLSQSQIVWTVVVLLILIFSKNLYASSLNIFLTFYMIDQYGITAQQSQLFLFAFLFAVAAGTFFGGPIGDRYGRRRVIWFSILGAAPFSLLMPYIHSLWGTCLLSMAAGAIMASSFPAIIIYAQEMMPGKVGTVGGLFFGFSFGAGAIAAALLGLLAEVKSISFVYEVCAYLPLIGLFTWFLPKIKDTKG